MPGSLGLQVEKQQFQIKKFFNERGCQRLPSLVGGKALNGNWAGRWEALWPAGRRRQNLGRQRPLQVLSITMDAMQRAGESRKRNSPAVWVHRAHSALNKPRSPPMLACVPVTEREGRKEGQKGKEEHTASVEKWYLHMISNGLVQMMRVVKPIWWVLNNIQIKLNKSASHVARGNIFW